MSTHTQSVPPAQKPATKSLLPTLKIEVRSAKNDKLVFKDKATGKDVEINRLQVGGEVASEDGSEIMTVHLTASLPIDADVTAAPIVKRGQMVEFPVIFLDYDRATSTAKVKTRLDAIKVVGRV